MDPGARELPAEVSAGVRSGDPKACEEFFKMMAPAALRVARRMVGDPHVAEDVVQDAFLAVFRKAGTLVDAGSLRSWFFAVLSNRCREYRRWKAVREAYVPEPPASTKSSGGLPDALGRVLEELSELDHILFDQVMLQRRSYEDVAREQGITTEVVRTRVYRLRKRLREELKR
ncbi:MAG: sigma-70 family RNA polymerase sigma factor [Planctomycetes bacterium]|nr:sigma-70 family RNA polymerase sigma factor [Planctomycetota bacterium]